MNQTSHSTEALARKEARRHGRDLIQIIGVPSPIGGSFIYWVRPLVMGVALNEGEVEVYRGWGGACSGRVGS